MKLFKKMLLAVAVAGLGLGFASCNPSEDENNTSDAIGTWYCHRLVIDDDENNYTIDLEMPLKLNADGTGTASTMLVQNGISPFK